MTSRDFCYWLQGYLELQPLARGAELGGMSPEQTHAVRSHLALVFKHEIDPNAGPPAHQTELDKIHSLGADHPGGGLPVFRC